jgi:hypothetical protein
MLLVGGCAAFLTTIAIAALISISMVSSDEARQREEQARLDERRTPGELARVPEVDLERIPPNAQQAKQRLAQLTQKIRTEDSVQDGFVKNLIKTRTDLKGLPFLMGGACRMDATMTSAFASAVATTHDALRAADKSNSLRSVEPVQRFWERWGGQDTSSGIAALTQIYGPQKTERRDSLVKSLQSVDHPASTKALARAAVYDFDYQVRFDALDGLKGRSKQDYTDVLMAGLHHPWPNAARNAANAIIRLERQDMVPQLVAFLAEPDPCAPVEKEVDGKPECTVREVVRINHHRNCLLCHAPAQQNTMPGGVVAVVPTPGESFPMPDDSGGSPYGSMPTESMIRADITYLRQDFSLLQPVANASPWPEMQRFDFLVRTRVLTPDEAERARKQAQPALSENHKAAIHALERLTGKHDVAPTAVAWSEAVNLPAPK